jgi:hypothetical protein
MSSCSNDDDSNNPTLDPFIGNWELVSETVNGITLPLECNADILEVSEDGSYTINIENTDTLGNCFAETFSGLWNNLGESLYSLNFTPDGPITTEVTFSSNNTVMSFTQEQTEEGVSVTVVITFNKV